MEYLCLPVEEGGLGLIDLEARNDAIDIVWLRDYLSAGDDRPWWAMVADDIMARVVPKQLSPGVKERGTRINTFTQDWHPKEKALPEDLRAIISVARRYGLHQDGLAVGRSALRAMPMWGHKLADQVSLRKLSAESAVTRCLKRNHRALTVGDFELLVDSLNEEAHRPNRSCDCEGCERMIVEQRCSDPNRCYERAKRLMDTLPPKWDPRGRHPEDYEELERRSDENDDPAVEAFDRRVTEKGTLADTFRIFSDGRPASGERMDVSVASVCGSMTVATDGSCVRNGEEDAIAGAGVQVTEGGDQAVAMRVPARLKQSNQVGEAVAALWAATELD
ncbi:hypothetical protein FKP32DRAFT_1566910, partial [Trametes sanguinea]